jgi:colanic acid biosynthesis glycosyl transferase WcaI
VLLLPLQLEDSYREMLADADCSVITQQEGTGSFFFPSKLLTSLAVGKPVITVADQDSELARATMDGRFGINVVPNQPETLARAIRSMADDAGQAGEMRRASRA